jgi:hypothetical protein
MLGIYRKDWLDNSGTSKLWNTSDALLRLTSDIIRHGKSDEGHISVTSWRPVLRTDFISSIGR